MLRWLSTHNEKMVPEQSRQVWWSISISRKNHPVNQTFRQDRIKATVGKHYGPRMVDQLFGDGDSHAHFRVILDDEPYRDREKIVLLHCVLWRIFLDGDPILTDDYYVSAGSSVHSIGFDFEGGMATIFNSGEGIGQFHARFGGEYQCIVSWNPSPENLKLLRVIVAYIADVWTNSTTQFLYHMLITYCQFPSQETQQARAPDPKRLALGQISGSCAFWSTALWLRFAGGWSNVINDLRLNRCAALVAQVNNNKFPRVWTSIIDMMIRRTVFESSRKPLQSALRNIQFGIIAHHELGTSIKVPPHETGKLGPEVMWDEDSLPNLSDMMPTFPQGSFVAQCRWLSDLTGKFRDSGWDEKMFFKFGLWARTVKEIYAAALYRDTKSADDAFWLLSAVSSLTAYLSQQKDNAIPPRVLVSWRTSFVVVLTILIEMNIRLGFVWWPEPRHPHTKKERTTINILLRDVPWADAFPREIRSYVIKHLPLAFIAPFTSKPYPSLPADTQTYLENHRLEAFPMNWIAPGLFSAQDMSTVFNDDMPINIPLRIIRFTLGFFGAVGYPVSLYKYKFIPDINLVAIKSNTGPKIQIIPHPVKVVDQRMFAYLNTVNVKSILVTIDTMTPSQAPYVCTDRRGVSYAWPALEFLHPPTQALKIKSRQLTNYQADVLAMLYTIHGFQPNFLTGHDPALQLYLSSDLRQPPARTLFRVFTNKGGKQEYHDVYAALYLNRLIKELSLTEWLTFTTHILTIMDTKILQQNFIRFSGLPKNAISFAKMKQDATMITVQLPDDGGTWNIKGNAPRSLVPLTKQFYFIKKQEDRFFRAVPRGDTATYASVQGQSGSYQLDAKTNTLFLVLEKVKYARVSDVELKLQEENKVADVDIHLYAREQHPTERVLEYQNIIFNGDQNLRLVTGPKNPDQWFVHSAENKGYLVQNTTRVPAFMARWVLSSGGTSLLYSPENSQWSLLVRDIRSIPYLSMMRESPWTPGTLKSMDSRQPQKLFEKDQFRSAIATPVTERCAYHGVSMGDHHRWVACGRLTGRGGPATVVSVTL